jgi:putative tricarboxylic transport membrane protein
VNVVNNLLTGLGIAFTPTNFIYCLIGATLGTLVGVLPGIGPLTTIAMLLPLTFKMAPVSSLIMLAGIYYGAHHAGSTTAIMLNMPGDPSSVVICMDGHPMARQGRAGPALCISALGSFFAGCVGVMLIALFSPPLAKVALEFAAPEYASMVVVALLATMTLSRGAFFVNAGMALLGLLLGTTGTDIETGTTRFTFGIPNLSDGMSFITVAVGLFAFGEVILHLSQDLTAAAPATSIAKVRGLWPTRADMALSWKPIVRGTALGSVLGLLPGTGPMVSSFASYSLERQLARDKSRFGHGAIEGVAGPEAANNAAAITHFIPMLTLGIPAGAAMALMLGAMTIQGIAPGPRVMVEHLDVFWGLIASMWIGNLMLLVLNLPMVGIWIRLLTIPYRLLYPAIIVFCCIGVYSVNNSAFDVALAAGMGLFGYVFHHIGCSPMPLVIGFILGPVLEQSLRRALLISRGDLAVFVTRPISLALLLLALGLLIYAAHSMLRLKPSVPSTEGQH